MEAENIILKKKVKQLQNQICQRTRNYLYHFKKSPGKKISSFNDVESQTDFNIFQSSQKQSKQFQSSQYLTSSLYNSNFSQKMSIQQQSKTPQKQKTRQFNAFQQNQQQKVLSKNSKISQSFPHQKQVYGGLKEDMQKFYNKQYRKLKKQIKKLKQHLQYEIQISTHTKEGLLISQEENYKFRIQIQDLRKQLKNINQSCGSQLDKKSVSQKSTNSLEKNEETRQELHKYKTQNQKYQEMITHLQTVKSEYLNKCIKSKQQIFHMKDQNHKLKLQINELKKALLKEHDETIAKLNQTIQSEKPFNLQNWVEIFKSKVYQISNCLPLRQQFQSTHLNTIVFKPQTVEELLSMLDRILLFCKNIQSWEQKNMKALQQERCNLLTVLSTILVSFPSSKNILGNIISQIQGLSHLVNFINRNSKEDEGQFNLDKINQDFLNQGLKKQIK